MASRAVEHLHEQCLAVRDDPLYSLLFQVFVQERISQMLLEIPGQTRLSRWIGRIGDHYVVLGLLPETDPDIELAALVERSLSRITIPGVFQVSVMDAFHVVGLR